MKKYSIKNVTVLALSMIIVTSFVSCGNKESKSNNATSSAEITAEKKVSTATNTDTKKTKDATKTNDVASTTINSDGKLSKEAIPKFEELYKSDPLKDFKINFAKQALSTLDTAILAAPANLQASLFTSKGLVTGDGPLYRYSTQASTSDGTKTKTDNLDGFFSKLTFYDSDKYLKCSSQASFVFNVGTDTTVVFSDEEKKMISILIPDFKPEELESKANEALSGSGKTIYLVETKSKTISVYNTKNNRGNAATLQIEITNDYPQK